MSLEERFTKIVKEMDDELTAAHKEIADLKSKLRTANFPNTQATKCGKCGAYKHTPLTWGEYGYICVDCLVKIKDEEREQLTKSYKLLSEKCRKSF